MRFVPRMSRTGIGFCNDLFMGCFIMGKTVVNLNELLDRNLVYVVHHVFVLI